MQFTVREDDLDFRKKIERVSKGLNISKNAVVNRAARIGVDALLKEFVKGETDKASTELLLELSEKINEGLRLLLKNQDGMKFDLSILQSAIYSIVNVKAMELEHGSGEISSEDLQDGMFDEPPKWIEELLKSE